MSYSRFGASSGVSRFGLSGASFPSATAARYTSAYSQPPRPGNSVLFGGGGGGVEPDYQHMFSQVAQITDQLFLSSAQPVTLERMRKIGISLIVNATMDVPCIRSPDIDCMQVTVDDTPFAQLRTYFDRVADRINHEVRKGGRVLVHCVAGVSRSSTLCMVYLMKYKNMTLRQAHDLCKSRRPYVRPNNGFWRQLIDYEQRLYGTNSVKLVNSSMGMIPDIYKEESNGFMWFPSVSSRRANDHGSANRGSSRYETSYSSSYSRNF